MIGTFEGKFSIAEKIGKIITVSPMIENSSLLHQFIVLKSN